MTPEPQVGDRLNITLKGVRVVETDTPHKRGRALRVAILTKDGGESEGAILLDSPSIDIEIAERVLPIGWPPLQSDLWKDKDGNVWFAVDVSPTNKPEIKLVPSYDANGYDPERVREDLGSLVLIHRAYIDDAADQHPEWPPREGDVWKDNDGDNWTAVNTPCGVELTLYKESSPNTVEWVRDTYGPLTLVSRKHDDQ
jgi:hypothetical protein